jgi:hypothetical protein
MTLDEFRIAVIKGLTTKFGGRLGKVTFMTDSLHVRPRWTMFAWIDGRAPKTSFPFASERGVGEDEQFRDFMKRVIFTLSRKATP